VQITEIQAAEIKFVRPKKGCSKGDRIINEDIRTDLGIFSLNKKQKKQKQKIQLLEAPFLR
jgi:hypothetical protein